jgi:hypothetical protein
VNKSLLHYALFALPALQFGAGTWLLAQRRRFFRAARSVEGVTIEPVVLPSRGADDGESYIVRFRYEVAGVRYEVENRGFTATRRGARAGRRVTVYYLEELPQRGRLVERGIALVAMMLVGIGLAIAGMLDAIVRRDGGL